MRERWSAAILNKQATETEPPIALVSMLLSRGSEGHSASQKGPKKSGFEQLKEAYEMRMEFDAGKEMRSMLTEGRQQQPQQQQYYLPPPQLPGYPYPLFSGYQQQQHFPPPPPPPPPQLSPSPTPTSRPSSSYIPSRPPMLQQRSSPIGQYSEEEEIIESFWEWKK